MDSKAAIILELGFGSLLLRDPATEEIICCNSRSNLESVLAKHNVDEVIYAPTASILFRSCGAQYYSTAKTLLEWGLRSNKRVTTSWPFQMLKPVGTQEIFDWIVEGEVDHDIPGKQVLTSMQFIEVFDRAQTTQGWLSAFNPLAHGRTQLLSLMQLLVPNSVKIFTSRDNTKSVDSLARVLRYLSDPRRLISTGCGVGTDRSQEHSRRVADFVDDIDYAIGRYGGINSLYVKNMTREPIDKDTLQRWSLAVSFIHSCSYLLIAAAEKVQKPTIFSNTRENDHKEEIVTMIKLVHAEWASNTLDQDFMDRKVVDGLTQEYRQRFH